MELLANVASFHEDVNTQAVIETTERAEGDLPPAPLREDLSPSIASSPPLELQDIFFDSSSDESVSVSFTTSGLPPSLQRIATSSRWLPTRQPGFPPPLRTGSQLLRDPEIFPGPSYTPPTSKISEESTEGRLLRCGPSPLRPPSSSPSSSSSLLYPNPLPPPSSSSGCSTILLPPAFPIDLVDFDFLLVKKTGTSVQHAHLHERGWTVALPFEKYSKLSLASGDGDDFPRPFGRETSAIDSDEEEEDERVMGCGCKTREVQCFGCGNVVGFQLVKGCPRHDVWSRGFTVVVFYPPSVHFSSPFPPSNRKRKRSSSISESTGASAPSYSQLRNEDERKGKAGRVDSDEDV
ncbi:hypothetical protein BDY24DRAFT_440406 [Mrakia frigida]|uniref:uncharacterized protein n=1 Tax=Mrakia frigida TaxID=29902 RepID=UPI003FCC1688